MIWDAQMTHVVIPHSYPLQKEASQMDLLK